MIAQQSPELSRILRRLIGPFRLILLIAMALIVTYTAPSQAAKTAFRFTNLGGAEGLKSTYVMKLLQDRQGFLWIATQDGLYRYDGYHFKTFKHNPLDPTSLASNYVQHLFQDSQGIMWISTPHGGLSQYHPEFENFSNYIHQAHDPDSLSYDLVLAVDEDQNHDLWIATFGGGLNRFNRSDGTFSHFRHDPNDPNSLSDDNVYSILVDSQDTIWAGTRNGGLNRFDRNTGQFLHYKHLEHDPYSISYNKISTIYEDSRGTIWAGTRGGGLNSLQRKDIISGKFTHYVHQPGDPESLGNDHVYAIFEDNKGTLWIGTNKGGLNRLDPDNKRFIRYQNSPQNPFSLADNDIRSIIQDHTGLIWVGTFGGGISKFDPSSERFGLVQHEPGNPNSLSEGNVWALLKDRAGLLWIGVESGLDRHDTFTDQYHHFRHDPNDPQSISDSDVRSLYEDSAGVLWVGTKNGGLNRFNPADNTFTHYRHDPDDNHSLSDDNVLVITEDGEGNLWVGTQNGLNRLDSINNTFIRYTHTPDDADSLSHDSIYALYTTREGSLWIGTGGGGLNRFNPDNDTFTRYSHEPDNDNSLSHDIVYAIDQGPVGDLWIGTRGGLNQLNISNGSFIHYRKEAGLLNDNVHGLSIDQAGNLWLAMVDGTSFFNPKERTIKNYIGTDIGCDGISQGAHFKASDGQLFFGSRGYCAFYAKQTILPSQPPNLVFTDFRLLNKTVPISTRDKPSPLTQVINNTDAITLSHEDNVLSFEFSALHYVSPKQNQFQYKLEGFNQDWIDTSSDNRRATYTNLPAGKHIFHLRASNNEGVWGQPGRSIKLTITPAPWLTWWAYLSYFLLIALVIGMILQQRYHKLQALILAKNNAEQARINAEQAQTNAELAQQHAEKANQAKSLFVADVSHEIRTPLNAVLGYTQVLDRDPTLAQKHRHKVKIIEKSGDHLLGLINNILDISKIEANAMTLNPSDFELAGLVHGIGEMLNVRCEEKQLKWQFVNQCGDQIPVYGDQGKLRQILINLLGNAVKFTEAGTITLCLAPGATDHYQFEVIDSGTGIAPEHQAKIFEAFGQTDEGAEQGGTGLGLAIAHKQVALMGGQLQLKSKPDTGSNFYFTLPLPPAIAPIEPVNNQPMLGLKLPAGVSVTALVVDDHQENGDVLKEVLQEVGIQVTQANNGRTALAQLHQATALPELIFMDISMPVMDGMTALKQIQQDFAGREPCCIAVTAHAMQQDLVYYKEHGFDHFIAKPFRLDEIYQCLPLLLDIDFDYQDHPDETSLTEQLEPTAKADEPASEKPAEPPQLADDVNALSIPPALFESLCQGAENYEVSKIEVHLAELSASSEQGRHLAEHLGHYISSYDMEGLLSELQRLGQRH